MLAGFHLDQCESTQDEGFRLLAEGQASPFYVSTSHQTKGRGRRGRVWENRRGKSLALSLCLRPEKKDLSGLSLVVGLAAAKIIRSRTVQIKWPNDLMYENQKVGGILIENRISERGSELVLGLGLNLYDIEAYRGIQLELDASEVANGIFAYWVEFDANGFAFFQKEFESKMWKKGEIVELKTERGREAVRILGVDERGFLLTESHGRMELRHNGEILTHENDFC